MGLVSALLPALIIGGKLRKAVAETVGGFKSKKNISCLYLCVCVCMCVGIGLALTYHVLP